MEDNKEIEIDLRKIFSMLKKKLVFIVMISLIGAILAGCVTNFFIEPKYTANVKLHVYSSSDSRLGASSSISSSEFDASQKLVNTYLVVVTSHTFLEKVADEYGNSITVSEIKSMMSCGQIDDTLAFRVNITSTDPQKAMDIANIIADECPDEIVRVLKAGGVEVIDYAILPTSPSSPDLKKNVMIGFIAAFAVSFVVFLIKELFDTSINDEKDLEKEFDIPILGTIPRLLPVTEKTKHSESDSDGTLSPPKPAFDFASNEKEEK